MNIGYFIIVGFEIFGFLFRRMLVFLCGFIVLNVMKLWSLGFFIMSLSLIFELVIRYFLCLSEEKILNGDFILLIKFIVI